MYDKSQERYPLPEDDSYEPAWPEGGWIRSSELLFLGFLLVVVALTLGFLLGN